MLRINCLFLLLLVNACASAKVQGPPPPDPPAEKDEVLGIWPAKRCYRVAGSQVVLDEMQFPDDAKAEIEVRVNRHGSPLPGPPSKVKLASTISVPAPQPVGPYRVEIAGETSGGYKLSHVVNHACAK